MFITKMFSYSEGLLFVMFWPRSAIEKKKKKKNENGVKRVGLYGLYEVRTRINLISSSKEKQMFNFVLVCSQSLWLCYDDEELVDLSIELWINALWSLKNI